MLLSLGFWLGSDQRVRVLNSHSGPPRSENGFIGLYNLSRRAPSETNILRVSPVKEWV